MIVCVAPTPAVDRLHEVSGPVVVGTIHRPERVVAVAGGKGLNAARAAALLGARVRAVVPLGGASGDWIEPQLVAAGIEVRRVATTAEPRVCVSVAGEGQELTEFYEGAPELARARSGTRSCARCARRRPARVGDAVGLAAARCARRRRGDAAKPHARPARRSRSTGATTTCAPA